MSYLRKSSSMLVASLGLVAISTAAQAEERDFNIAAGSLQSALDDFSRQSRRQIIYKADEVRNAASGGVRGTMPVEEALRILLAGSGFDFRADVSGAIAIIRSATTGNFRTGSGAGEAAPAERGIAEILVIGSRSRNLDVRRTEDDAQPYVVFDREKIASSQATSVEEFLRTRLPQNAGYGGSQSQATGTGAPFSSFNLRGLGSSQTLILVNGRRIADRATGLGAPEQGDVNGIPLASIERIEVLPSSAGGIYGGNAVGGVINIILRSDYRGVELSATYSDSLDFHAPGGRIDVNGGFALEGGRTTVTFGGSLSRNGTLRVGDREDLIQDGIDLANRNRSPYNRSISPPVGNGINIRSADGSVLVLNPAYGGTSLGSNVTNLPLGYAGVDSDNGAALIANAGSYNLEMPDDLSGRKRGLYTAPEVRSGTISVRRKFSSSLDLFVDYAHFENRGTTYSADVVPTVVALPAGWPTNPFQQDIRVSFPNPDLKFPYKSSSDTDRLTVGAIMRLPFDWAINAEFNKTWSSTRSAWQQYGIDGAGRSCLSPIDPSLPPCPGEVLDPLVSPINYEPYLFTEPTDIVGPLKSTFTNPSLRASGRLFKLPGGAAKLTLSIQHEATDVSQGSQSTTSLASRNLSYRIYPEKSQRTTSEYAELTLPVVSPANDIPLMRELEFTAAVRHSATTTKAPSPGISYIGYDPLEELCDAGLLECMGGYTVILTSDPDLELPDFEQAVSRFQNTSFTLAGRYAPIEGLTFRASYATGFLPPNIAQIGLFEGPSNLCVPDPFRGSENDCHAYTSITGGDVDLEPELSKSLSIGLILTPVENLRLSVDYTRIHKKGEIGAIPLDYLIANPDLFPGRVERADPTESDIANGYQGKITKIYQTASNLLRSRYQMVDVKVDYDFETVEAGNFHLYAMATWQPDTIRQMLADESALNYSGNRDGPLKWQGNAGLDWTLDNLTVRWNTQFYGSYNIYNTFDTDTALGQAAVADAIELQGKRRIPSQMYSDLYASYDFKAESGFLHGLRISAGVQNIFDKQPPVIAITSYLNAGYSTYGDPRMRRFTLSLRKSFGGS